MSEKNVAVLGASQNPERYSNKAVKMLMEYGYKVFPVNPSGRPVNGLNCYKSLNEIKDQIDTITVYLSKENSAPIIGQIIEAKPRRVILNPRAESEELSDKCKNAGIIVQEACTLVLLRTGQF